MPPFPQKRDPLMARGYYVEPIHGFHRGTLTVHHVFHLLKRRGAAKAVGGEVGQGCLITIIIIILISSSSIMLRFLKSVLLMRMELSSSLILIERSLEGI